MTLRLTFIIGLASMVVSCGGSAKHSAPEAGAGTSTSGGSSSVPSAGSGGASTGGNSAGGIASGGATSAPLAGSPDSGGSRSSGAGITTAGGTATGGKVTTGGAGAGGASTGGREGGAGGTTTGGTSRSGGASAGGATTTVSSASGGAKGGTTTGGKSTVSTAGASGGTTIGTATGGTSATGGSTGGACAAGPPLTGGTQYCDQNGSGSYGNYTWRYWSNMKPGCLTATSDGAFRVNWDFRDTGDLIAGVGPRFDGTKTHQELGTFSADFAESKTGTAGTASYIGIYGYSEDALVEFFISDDAFQPPIKPWNSSLKGTLAVDGGIYDIYKTTSASAKGLFTTIHSIRQERRSCGHISISTHFSRWEELGMTVGKLQYVEVMVEIVGETGSIDFTTAKVEVN